MLEQLVGNVAISFLMVLLVAGTLVWIFGENLRQKLGDEPQNLIDYARRVTAGNLSIDKNTTQAATRGIVAMQATLGNFSETPKGAQHLSTRIGKLGEQSDGIGKIIQVIE
ncbi:MAG: hypothetical protein R3194_07095 [Limnobacter sp.]|nr:hypothetical protein [Limnobacter sp.]